MLIQKLSLVFVVLLLLGIAAYKMVLSPVSVTFKTYPQKIITGSSSPVSVMVYPLNRFGFKVPFRHLDGRFVISEGADKIRIVEEKSDELIFQTKDIIGTLVILYYSREVPIPVEIILNIENASLA